MSTVFTPTQDIANIQDDLKTIAVGNLGWNPDLVFADEPDDAPPDGSILILMRQFDILANTNGKLRLKLTFAILYVLDPSVNRQTRPTLNSYVLPFLLAYEAWFNQALNGDYFAIDTQKGGVGRITYANQAYDALTTFVSVDTEFNIPLA